MNKVVSWFSEGDRIILLERLDSRQVVIIEETYSVVFNKAVERALAMIPHVLPSLLKYAANLKNIEDSYIKANPDLVEHTVRLKELIGITSSDHPDWDITKIVEESGKDLRKEIKTVSSIGAIDLTSLERPSKEDLNGKLKDS